MKKEKMVQVTICDFCKQEREARPCGGCGADACNICSLRFNVTVKQWREAKEYMTGLTSDFDRSPDYSGIFCKQCSPETNFTQVGFIKREKAA